MPLALRYQGHHSLPDADACGLTVGREFVIGRKRVQVGPTEDAELRIQSRLIGRAHAILQLSQDGEGIAAEFRSATFPHINGQEVRATNVRLAVGDVVSFAGTFDFVVVKYAS